MSENVKSGDFKFKNGDYVYGFVPGSRSGLWYDGYLLVLRDGDDAPAFITSRLEHKVSVETDYFCTSKDRIFSSKEELFKALDKYCREHRECTGFFHAHTIVPKEEEYAKEEKQ